MTVPAALSVRSKVATASPTRVFGSGSGVALPRVAVAGNSVASGGAPAPAAIDWR